MSNAVKLCATFSTQWVSQDILFIAGQECGEVKEGLFECLTGARLDTVSQVYLGI